MNLLTEFENAEDTLRRCETFSLKSLDITWEGTFRSGGIGLAKIRTDYRCFEFNKTGHWAVILGCWWPEEPGLYCQFLGVPDLLDLVAFDPRQPDRWFYRLGEFDHILGRAQLARGPVATHADPLSWMRHNCDGVCDLTGLERRWLA